MAADSGKQGGDRRVTLRDIAAAVGYSHVTVARALSGRAGVGAEARERIRAAAREMDYRPDPAVNRMMRRIRENPEKRTAETVALVHDVAAAGSGPGYPGMREGVFRQADLMGYRIDEFAVGAGGLLPGRLKGILEARGIRGLVLMFCSVPEIKGGDFADFLRVELPLPTHQPGIISVGRDPFRAYTLIYERLRGMGFSRVGFAKRHCIDGLEHRLIVGCVEADLPRPDRTEEPGYEPLFVYDEDDPDTVKRMRDWVERNRLEVVVGGGAAFPFVKRLGYRVPEELGFVSTNLAPTESMTGAALNLGKVGRTSVRLLDGLLAAHLYSGTDDSEVVFVPAEWIEGTSLLPREKMGGGPSA